MPGVSMDRLDLHLKLTEQEASLLLGVLIERAALADTLWRDAWLNLPEDWVNSWQILADQVAASIRAARQEAPVSGVVNDSDL